MFWYRCEDSALLLLISKCCSCMNEAASEGISCSADCVRYVSTCDFTYECTDEEAGGEKLLLLLYCSVFWPRDSVCERS